MSDKNTVLLVEIAEAQINDMLDKYKDSITSELSDKFDGLHDDVDHKILEVKDTVENIEYEVEEFKDAVNYLESDMESKYDDLKDDYNDLDNRLSELQNDNSAETFEQRLEALEKNTSNSVPSTNIEYINLRKDVDHLLGLQELQINLFNYLFNHNNDFSKYLQNYIDFVNGYKKD